MPTSTELDPERTLQLLADEEGRAILSALDEPMTAQEVAGECDIPRSTAYRKVELLEEAGLVRDEIRVQANGGHPVTYQRVFETVDVVITGGGPRVSLTRRESGDGRRADDH